MGLSDARKRLGDQAAAVQQPSPLAQRRAQQAAEYPLLVTRIDPLIQGLRCAMKRRGYARLTLTQRFVHRCQYGMLQNQPSFEQFTSRRDLGNGLYRDVRAGKKYLRVDIDGRLLVGLNIDKWYLRVRERCASDCCWGRIDDTNREMHMVLVASNTGDYVDVRELTEADAIFRYAEEQIAFCAEALGIPDDEVEASA